MDKNSKETVEKYQIAGLDERERGFSRLMNMELGGDGYRAILRYEATALQTGGCDTSQEALNELIALLRARGYSQIRSRLDFRGTVYFGSREPWTEYPDPNRQSEAARLPSSHQLARRTGWIGRVLQLLRG